MLFSNGNNLLKNDKPQTIKNEQVFNSLNQCDYIPKELEICEPNNQTHNQTQDNISQNSISQVQESDNQVQDNVSQIQIANQQQDNVNQIQKIANQQQDNVSQIQENDNQGIDSLLIKEIKKYFNIKKYCNIIINNDIICAIILILFVMLFNYLI